MHPTPPADAQRMAELLGQVSRFGAGDEPGIWRVAFSAADLGARRWFVEAARHQGLDVDIDRFANLHATLPGTEAGLAALGTGSHLDTVPGGGNLDGAAGVVVGLEVARLLADTGLRHPVRIVDFSGEEAGPFGISTIGSRGLAGRLTEDELALRDDGGARLADRIAAAREDAGVPPAGAVRLSAFVEVHIEQGDRLDRAGLPIAVVEGITAIRRTRVRIDGAANHAGTTVRSRRRDALLATAAMLHAVERVWIEQDPEEQVSVTVGRCDMAPNAINVIPARVDLVLEVRCPDPDLLARVDRKAGQEFAMIGRERGVEVTSEPLFDQPPRRFASSVTDLLAEVVDGPRLWSLAGHDAGYVNLVCPAGMVFVRTPGGVSHAPGEDCRPEDLAAAADAVAAAFVELDGELA